MEVAAETICIPVAEETQVGDARRQVVRLAEGRGMEEQAVGRVAVVATELAGNLVKHTAGGGELLVRPLARAGAAGVELLALDRGAGMEDIARCLQDGYSTVGTAGEGLGAVSRMADLFQLHSAPGAGTAVLAQVWSTRPGPAEALPLGVVQQSKPGQVVCGDGWAAAPREGGVLLMVCDGLGHGPGAADASRAASDLFHAHAQRSPAELLELLHGGMRSTRGAAIALAEVSAATGEVRYAGVGNIAGQILGAGSGRSLVSHNGIVGHEVRKIQEFCYPWAAGDLLVMHSDGLGTRWGLEEYIGLGARHPALIAGVLYRDYARGTDDVTVAVVRHGTAAVA